MAITLDGTAGITTPPVTVTNVVGVGGATPASSGAGITFPATASASTDANTLDDYRENTWTPVQGAGLTVVGTFSSAGTYIKVGRLVYVYGYVAGSTSVALASGNLVVCTGLPFTATNELQSGTASNAASTANSVFQIVNTTVYSTGAFSATAKIAFSATYYTS